MNEVTLSVVNKRVLTGSLTIIGVLAGLYLIYLARTPLMWIGIAGFMAVAINPIVHRLQRYMPKRSIGLATLLLLIIFCIVTGLLTWLFFAPVVDQTVKLIAAIPEFANHARSTLAGSPLAHSAGLDSQTIKSQLEANVGQLSGLASRAGQVLLTVLTGVVNAVVAFVTILSLMFFMTVEGRKLKHSAIQMVAPERRKQALALGHKIYDIINGYIIGNFILSAMFGVASGLVLWLVGSPYFLVLGLLAGLLDLIPLVGSTIGAILIAAVCLLSGQPWAGVIFAVFTAVYVQVENSVLNPMVYSKKVDVSPLVVLIAVILGAAVAGVVGVLLAIPIAAIIKEVGRVVFKDRLEIVS